MVLFPRRRLLKFLGVGLLSCLLVVGCNSSPVANQNTVEPITITVSAAASLQDALKEIDAEFRRTYPHVSVDYNFGSSGALQQQIERGAPVDVFFSAAAKQMDALAAKNLISLDTRRDIVSNSLVLIAPANTTLNISDMAQLKDANISKVAVGEFRSVPAGQYSQEVFEALGLLESLQPRFVFSNNVRGVLSAVESGNADLGMVYASDAALTSRVKVLHTAPKESHRPIIYPVATVSSSTHPDQAKLFIEFLQSDTAQDAFAQFGFLPIAP